MLSSKGNKNHRLLGRLFFFSMLVVSITAVALALFKNSNFLFHIGIFVFYQNYAGYQSVKNKSLIPDWKDKLVLYLAILNAIMMLYSLNLVLLIFALISSFLTISDLWLYWKLYKARPIKKLNWLARHLGMMIGAYIGTFTAFLVVNASAFQPYWFIWLAPTFFFVPLIIYWTNKYTNKTIMLPKK